MSSTAIAMETLPEPAQDQVVEHLRDYIADLADERQPTVVRTERGLSIAGTRITLYSIMDYLQAGWPTERIRDRLHLTDTQIADVMAYIEAQRATVEAEYQLVLQQAEENRHYWEARNRDRLTQLAAQPPPPAPGQEAIRAKLQAQKSRLGLA